MGSNPRRRGARVLDDDFSALRVVPQSCRGRHDGLVKTQGGKVIIEDWDGLRAAGEFDPTYLHLKKPAPSAREAAPERTNA